MAAGAFHCCSGHILGGIPGVFMDHVKNNTEKKGKRSCHREKESVWPIWRRFIGRLSSGTASSILPLAVVLVLSAGFQVYVVKALFAGCILTVITGHKNLLPKLKTSLSQGITAAYGPILSVSATYAIGAVVKT